GHGADVELLLVVAIELFGDGDGLLCDLDVFAGVGEFPIGGDGVCGGGDGLLGESEIGDFAIVLGNDDIAAIDEAARAGQERLRKGDGQGGLHVRIEEVVRVGRGAGIVPSRGDGRAGNEALLVLGVVNGAVAGQAEDSGSGGTDTGKERVVDGGDDIGDLDGLGNDGVVEERREIGGGTHRDASGCAIAITAGAGFEEADIGHPGVVARNNDVHAV